MIQLPYPIEVDTPAGHGRAVFFDMQGPDADALWVVVLENGSFVIVQNREVRAAPNWTYGLRRDEVIAKIAASRRKDDE